MIPFRWAKLASVAMLFGAGLIAIGQGRGFWSTADQRGQRFVDEGNFKEAAATFADPFRQGAAWVKAGDFKSAASVYAALPGAEAAFNHGNALVMQGEYDAAIKRYDRAIELRPGWTSAKQNREIAVLRGQRTTDNPDIGTEGELGADEIVFDLDNQKNAEASEEETKGGQASDDELRQAWLRQVQTTPRDFLKSKFAYQDAMRAREESGPEPKP